MPHTPAHLTSHVGLIFKLNWFNGWYNKQLQSVFCTKGRTSGGEIHDVFKKKKGSEGALPMPHKPAHLTSQVGLIKYRNVMWNVWVLITSLICLTPLSNVGHPHPPSSNKPLKLNRNCKLNIYKTDNNYFVMRWPWILMENYKISVSVMSFKIQIDLKSSHLTYQHPISRRYKTKYNCQIEKMHF